LVVQEGHDYTLKTTDLHLDGSTKYLSYYYHDAMISTANLQPFDPSNPVVLTPNTKEDDFTVFYFSPILSNGLIILGETGKWVPISHQRITNFYVGSKSVILDLIGATGEMVNIDWAMPNSMVMSETESREKGVGDYMVMTAKCTLDVEGSKRLIINLDMTYTC